jgi:hypothetical protein
LSPFSDHSRKWHDAARSIYYRLKKRVFDTEDLVVWHVIFDQTLKLMNAKIQNDINGVLVWFILVGSLILTLFIVSYIVLGHILHWGALLYDPLYIQAMLMVIMFYGMALSLLGRAKRVEELFAKSVKLLLRISTEKDYMMWVGFRKKTDHQDSENDLEENRAPSSSSRYKFLQEPLFHAMLVNWKDRFVGIRYSLCNCPCSRDPSVTVDYYDEDNDGEFEPNGDMLVAMCDFLPPDGHTPRKGTSHIPWRMRVKLLTALFRCGRQTRSQGRICCFFFRRTVRLGHFEASSCRC